MTQTQAKIKWLKIAPRKLSRVAEAISGKLASEAMQLLQFMPQKGARLLAKAIKSAVANAINNHKMPERDLVIKSVWVNKGVVMKRWRAKARGRVGSRQKRSSHLTVCLENKNRAEAA